MKRPSIKFALVGVFSLFAVLFAITAYCSINGMAVMNSSATDLSNSVVPSIRIAKDIQLHRFQLRSAVQSDLLAQSPEDIVSAAANVLATENDLQSSIDEFKPYISNDLEAGVHKSLTPLVQEYRTKAISVLALSAAGKKTEAFNLFTSDLVPVGQKITDQTSSLIKIALDEGSEATKADQTAYSNAVLVIYCVLGACLAVIAGSSYFALASIAKPIRVITESMTGLAGGDTAKAIPFANRSDEIGAMAGAVEVFRQVAIANNRLEQEADAARLETEADRVRLTAEAEAAAQTRLWEATAGLAAGLRRLATGDLAFELSEPFAADFEDLRHDLNGTIIQLGDTLRSVAQSTASIDRDSREISQSSDDLSRRTEQQAASLEETAAALDQITVNVSNSSKRADEARAVALQANTSAAHSGKVVADAVDAMQRIEDSSAQISNIIGVIDEIAFQTNLLALNAGVEAARAGDAGKGFAVVAQEVRELAQRSAKAAKEIKELIRNSTTEVENGVKLVRETGVSLQTIEQYIVTINRHMDAIATSSREQSTGLVEVNTAVNQMDQVTQQNAAMVEQTNAAGATLAAEAGRLRDLIAQFNLGAATRSLAQPIVAQKARTGTAQPIAARWDHRPVTSPARKMTAGVAKAFASASGQPHDNWEEF